MKKLLLILLLFFFSNTLAQQELWTDISESQITQTGERYIIPDSYRVVKLNLTSAKNLLQTAPLEFTLEALEGRSVIELPMPDGTFQEFKFWESPTMEPELQAKFPEIRTYTGQGIDDPYATLKFDLTPLGFHAQILSPNGRVFIDPYSKADINNYISYYTKYFRKQDAVFDCEVFYHEFYTPEPDYSTELIVPTGPQLRTYRLANAATGEYTIFHGGTVTAGLSAVTTSVNRVNGVYERETAVRMILVANNNLIIYTNPSTDPYTNNNGSTMLGQNQTNIDAVIGSANYDIGHVFSTGGGGVAYLGVVCVANWKARGVTGSSSPVGDPFDIDYVAHEMGHQFGANHTFNGNAGSCSGNRNASTAYEPGSGSTIMAYAGICSPQNLQSNSDPFFHVISFDEIVAYTNSGSGNSCAVITSTGNSAPVVNVPAGGFFIPKSTPFSLTGSATDPNGDALTYSWEEFDLGPAGSPTAPTGDAPIFRSFVPSSSPTRIFPKLSDLLNNTSTIGEILPSYGRNLKFRFTVRDNRAGGGGVDWKQINFAVDNNSGPFVVTSPNTNVSWQGNTQQTVTWNVANTTASPVNCANVRILLSTDGGNNFNTVIFSSTPNDGSETIVLPNLPTTQARIKVEAVGNIFFDISNANFTIVNNPLSNPASFSASAVSSSQIDLSFTTNAGNNNVVIVWNNTGSFTTPSGTPPAPGQPFAGGTLLSNGTSSPANHTGLLQGTEYYYKAFSYNGVGYSSGLTANATTFSLTDFSVNLSVSDGCANSMVLVFGTAPGATDCFDLGFDLEAPPPPPPGAFDARFSTCALHLFTDIRETNTDSERIWNVHFNPAENCAPVTLSWNPSQLPDSGYFHLVDPFLGTLVNVNMRLTNTYTDVMGIGHLQIKYNYEFCSNYSVAENWNMLSLPLGVADPDYTLLFPDAEPGSLYGYSNGYFSAESLIVGSGYWLKFPAAGFAVVCGSDVTETIVSLSPGWNMFGGPNCNIPVEDISDPGGIIIPGTIYSFSSGYSPASSVDATKAYWVKTTAAGSITLNCGTAFLSKRELLFSEETFSSFSKIEIKDATQNKQTIYFNGELSEEINIESFSLPPVPPAGSFDARLSNNYKLTEADEAEILISAINYPLVVELTDLNSSVKYVLKEFVNGAEAGSRKIVPGNKILITNKNVSSIRIEKEESILSSFKLEQNYPNPFNPVTNIKFSIPIDSKIKLNLYNILGELVQTISEGLYEPGFYEIVFDAKNLPSGIYIYRIESEEFTQSRKMILLK